MLRIAIVALVLGLASVAGAQQTPLPGPSSPAPPPMPPVPIGL